MIPFLSAITYWGEFSEGTKEAYEALDGAFDSLFQDMADYALYRGFSPGEGFSFVSDLKHLFDYAFDNPLIVSLITIAILLLAFGFCPLIFRSFRR